MLITRQTINSLILIKTRVPNVGAKSSSAKCLTFSKN